MTPDDVTALIAHTVNDFRTLDDPDDIARAVRDALSAAGWLNDGEEQVIARRVLDMRHVQKMLRDEVAMMAGAEREKHVADGRAEERRLWMEGKGNA